MIEALPDDLNLLLALDVLLRERHVTRAAKRLGITQSAASQRLGRLREFFGDALLAPGRPLLALTPRAEALADPLAQALASLRAAVQAGAPFDPATSERRFVLLGNDLLEAIALPRLLPLLAREAPHITVQVDRAEADFVRRLERGTADLAFVPEFLVPPSSRQLRLPEEGFVTLMRRDHPAASRRLTLERYLELGHVLIAPHGMPGSLVDRALEARGRRRRIVAQVQHFVTVPFLIAASDLVVTCPATVAAVSRPFGLRAVRPPVELGVDRSSAVWHERVHDDPGHRWLRSWLSKAIRTGARTRPNQVDPTQVDRKGKPETTHPG
ncbi:LysR family transcriptional regulator [Sorangium sp. So ce367]|uniref:LysR family transcriptional regulator n=1 Tax=Sorangium sp. So ce367 TaxID=3133305 RepID=UPI003F5F1189